MANIYAHASVEGTTVFEETYAPKSRVSRDRILIKVRSAVEQFISTRYDLSYKGEDLVFAALNDDEEMIEMMLGYSESWISKDGLVSIVVELEEEGD